MSRGIVGFRVPQHLGTEGYTGAGAGRALFEGDVG